jgi:hypothetical protein
MICLSIMVSLMQRPRIQTLMLGLMLIYHLSLGTLVLALGLIILIWHRQHRFPLRLGLILILVLGVWVVLTRLGWGEPQRPQLSFDVWSMRVQRLLGESVFYWLALPLAGVGVIALYQRRPWILGGLVLWSIALSVDGDVFAAAVLGTLILTLIGVGVDQLIRRVSQCRYVDWHGPRLGLGLILMMPVGAAQITSLSERIFDGLFEHRQLEARAAAWLDTHSQLDVSVLGSARVGYLARRNLRVWSGNRRSGVIFSQHLRDLRAHPPDYCISFDSLAWDDLLRTGWFQDVYMPVNVIRSSHIGTSPFKIWARRPRTFDLGNYQPLSVRLPGQTYWVGTRYAPYRITAGDAISVTLYLHNPQSSVASEVRFQSVLYLDVPNSDHTLAEAGVLNYDVVLDDPSLGQIMAETFVLDTPDDIGYGAYPLNASVLTEDLDREGFIYEGESAIPIDRVTLGYIIVPWSGSMRGISPIGATLADQITLIGYEVEGSAEAGEGLAVNLYWEAVYPLRDLKTHYHVFVHLLDEHGDLVSQHDGLPVGGRYPLQAWVPGDVVRDPHLLTLPSDLSPGSYQLQVGMYTWPDFTRLTARDAAGTDLSDGVVVLGEFSVP